MFDSHWLVNADDRHNGGPHVKGSGNRHALPRCLSALPLEIARDPDLDRLRQAAEPRHTLKASTVQIPQNTFKAALRAGTPQIGLWVGLADANAAAALAGAGHDWLLLDGEHAPNDPQSILAQLRAVAPYPVQPVVRPVIGDEALVKQYLDIGAQTLLVPMIDSAEHAARMVRAMRYAPAGIRDMGAALARASRWNQVEHCPALADA